jgi:hypothetical protein
MITCLFVVIGALVVSLSHALCNTCLNGVVSACDWNNVNQNVSTRICSSGRCSLDPALRETGVCRDLVVAVSALWVAAEKDASVSWHRENRTLKTSGDVLLPLNNSASHTRDLFFGGFGTGLAMLSDVRSRGLVVSLRVNVTAQQRDASNADVACRIRSISIKDSDGKHTTPSRDNDALWFGDTTRSLVFGDRFDLWDDQIVTAQLFDASVTIDVELASRSGAVKWSGSATCVISAVELIVELTRAPEKAVPGWYDYADADEPFFDAVDGAGVLFTLVDDAESTKWRYNSRVPSASWVLPSFDDSSWKEDTGVFNNDKSRKGTTISDEKPHGFFRTRFVLPFDDAIECYTLLRTVANFVSGGRVFLNGYLVWQHNVPLHPPQDPNNDTALSPERKQAMVPGHIIEPVMLALPPRENVLAIEVHEHPDADGRLIMDFALDVATTCRVPMPTVTATRMRTTRQPETFAPRPPRSTAPMPTTTGVVVAAGSGAPSPVSGLTIGALVLAIVFCIVGLVIYYLAVIKRRGWGSVLKI